MDKQAEYKLESVQWPPYLTNSGKISSVFLLKLKNQAPDSSAQSGWAADSLTKKEPGIPLELTLGIQAQIHRGTQPPIAGPLQLTIWRPY